MARRVPGRSNKSSASRDRVGDIVVEAWLKLDLSPRGGAFASALLADAFRREPTLGPRARSAAAARLYGMIHLARRIGHALEDSGCPARGSRRALAEYTAYRMISKELTPAAAAEACARIDWPRVAARDAAIARETDPRLRLALSRSLPDWLAARLFDEYGGETDALADALNRRAPMTVRVNSARISRDVLLARLRKDGIDAVPGKFAQTAVVLESGADIFSLPAWREGLIEPQDEASQLVAELASPAPGTLVVDACAGAGGKTLALGAAMGDTGRLVALDVHSGRLEELRRRARRAGLSNLRALRVEPDAWPPEVEALAASAQRVLIDAPCSGTGALRRKPEARWRLDAADVERLGREQEQIARRAMMLCAPGGRVIYATCSLLRSENEDVVERLLNGGAFQRVPIKEILGRKRAEALCDASGLYLKMSPHRHGTDGFFAAVLRRG